MKTKQRTNRTPVLRVPARLVGHMTGTGWWQTGEWNRTPEGDALATSVKDAIDAAKCNSDDSYSIRPTPAQIAFLRRQADFLADAARGDSGWDADARADLNSARAFMRRVDEIAR
jgi:hypothetical protein